MGVVNSGGCWGRISWGGDRDELMVTEAGGGRRTAENSSGRQ
jgi:hypothetical protein